MENASSEVNGWLSGEINRFITAITDASNVASLFSDGGNMNGLAGEKVEKVINSFATSAEKKKISLGIYDMADELYGDSGAQETPLIPDSPVELPVIPFV